MNRKAITERLEEIRMKNLNQSRKLTEQQIIDWEETEITKFLIGFSEDLITISWALKRAIDSFAD